MADRHPSRLFQWVGTQMSGLAPDWVRAMFLGAPMARPLIFESGADKILRRRGRVVAPLALLDGRDMPEASRRKAVNVDAIIPRHLILRREITAPASARRTLRSVARLDLLRQTPFREADVFWALGSERSDRDGQVKAAQWVIRRSDVAQWRARLRKAGLKLRRVYVDGAEEVGALADFSADLAPAARRWRRLNAVLALSAAGLAAVWWLYPGWIASQQLEKLSREQTALQAEALTLRREIESLRQLASDRTAFLDLVYRRPLLSHMLRELTVALPDSVWTDTFVFRTDRVVVTGEAEDSAADLVIALSGNPRFGNPRLSGPVSSTANGTERFELTVDVGAGRR